MRFRRVRRGRPSPGAASFDGCCPVCGWEGVFRRTRDDRPPTRDFLCGGCGAQLLLQAEASAIADEFGSGRSDALASLVRRDDFQSLAIYHIGTSGAVRRFLSRLPDYRESSFRPQVEPGAVLSEGPRCTNQDHGALTFSDESFDLVVSSHVLEHVPDPASAFREAHRVLRPGGRYIFSIPGRYPKDRSVTRARIVDGSVVHDEEPRYHDSPEGDRVLVFTDFGRDVLDLLTDAGFVATIRRPHRAIQEAQSNFVVVAVRPPTPVVSGG